MSRSVYGTVCIRYSERLEDEIKLFTENGFKEIAGDYEYVWVKENLKTNFATYVKTEHMKNVFILSVWLRDMGDESCRELCFEAFESHTPEAEDAENIIKSLLRLFENKLKKIECYIYESNLP